MHTHTQLLGGKASKRRARCSLPCVDADIAISELFSGSCRRCLPTRVQVQANCKFGKSNRHLPIKLCLHNACRCNVFLSIYRYETTICLLYGADTVVYELIRLYTGVHHSQSSPHPRIHPHTQNCHLASPSSKAARKSLDCPSRIHPPTQRHSPFLTSPALTTIGILSTPSSPFRAAFCLHSRQSTLLIFSHCLLIRFHS